MKATTTTSRVINTQLVELDPTTRTTTTTSSVIKHTACVVAHSER